MRVREGAHEEGSEGAHEGERVQMKGRGCK